MWSKLLLWRLSLKWKPMFDPHASAIPIPSCVFSEIHTDNECLLPHAISHQPFHEALKISFHVTWKLPLTRIVCLDRAPT